MFRLNYTTTPTSAVTVFAGTNGLQGTGNGAVGTGRLFAPLSFALDLDGNAYIVDNYSLIRKISPSGTLSAFISGNGNMRGLCVDDNGTLFVCQTNYVQKITSGGTITTFAGQATAGYGDGTGTSVSFNALSDIALDSAGNAYVTESLGNRVRKITPAGVVSTLAGSIAASAGTSGNTDGVGTNARFSAPSGITIDSAGYVYVLDAGNYRVRKITPDGAVTTFVGGSTYGSANGTGTNATFSFNLRNITIDLQGVLYLADYGNGLVRKITPEGVVTTFDSSLSPYWVATQHNTYGSVYALDFPNYVIKKITTTTDTTYSSTTLTGTLQTDFDTQLNSSYITVPASTSNAKIARFSLGSRVPTTLILPGQWILSVFATVGTHTSPASFYFRILDGALALFSASATTSVNLASPLQVYTSSLSVSSQTIITNLAIEVYATTQASSALILGFNGLNASYLNTTVLPFSESIVANDYQYRFPGTLLKLAAMNILAFSLNSTTNASTPIPYAVTASAIPNSANTGSGGFWLAPKCRFIVLSSGVTSLDILNNSSGWQYFSNDLTAITTRTYQLYLI
jgi:hypothetical protein